MIALTFDRMLDPLRPSSDDLAGRDRPDEAPARDITPAKFVCYFDGCCEPVNPGGAAGYGAVVFEDGNRVAETARSPPRFRCTAA